MWSTVIVDRLPKETFSLARMFFTSLFPIGMFLGPVCFLGYYYGFEALGAIPTELQQDKKILAYIQNRRPQTPGCMASLFHRLLGWQSNEYVQVHEQ
jgi:hypothetical protein